MSGKAWQGAVIAALMTAVSAPAHGADTARAFTLRLYDAYRTGAPDSGTTVNCPVPVPAATAVLQFAPSELTVTV